MGVKSRLEDAIASRERRLFVLRRQAVRGKHYVIGQLKRADREYFAGWSVCVEAAAMNGKEADHTTSNRPYGIDVTCPSCASFDCVRAGHYVLKDWFCRFMGKFPWQCRRCMHRFYLRRRSIA
jgi:hypothetical protein